MAELHVTPLLNVDYVCVKLCISKPILCDIAKFHFS